MGMPNDGYPEIIELRIYPPVERRVCFATARHTTVLGSLDVHPTATCGAPLLLLAPTHPPRARGVIVRRERMEFSIAR